MGLVMQFIFLLLILCAIASSLVIQGSAEDGVAPPPATFSATPPIVEGPSGLFFRPPIGSPPPKPAPVPEIINGQAPLLSPSTPTTLPPSSSNAPPINFQVPSLAPSDPQRKPPQTKNPVLAPQAPVPIVSPLTKSPQNAPSIHPPMPVSVPPSSHQSQKPDDKAPLPVPIAPVSPLTKSPQNAPSIHPPMPVSVPPSSHQSQKPDAKAQAPHPVPIAPVQNAPPPREMLQNPPPVQPIIQEAPPPSILPAPIPSPPRDLPRNPQPIHPTVPKVPPPNLPEPNISPVSAPPSIKRDPTPAAAPPNLTPKGIPPVKTLPVHKAPRQSPPNKSFHPPASLPSASFNRHHNATKTITSPAPLAYLVPPPPPPPTQQGSFIPPAPLYPPKLNPDTSQRHRTPPPLNSEHPIPLAPTPSPISPSVRATKHPIPPAPTPSPVSPSVQATMPFLSPKVSPSRPSPRIPEMPLLTPFHALPPPPPNEDCTSITCKEPLTNTPPGSPCGCVWPMQVGLRLSVALYTFFPLVSELANEIAVGVFMRQSQVRIMGANAASQDPEKTIVLIDLVPLGERIDNTTAYLIYQRFWHKQVLIRTSYFGDYEVLYVRYPGLPPSPPSAPSSVNIIGSDPYTGNDNNGVTRKPLGVDVRGQRHKDGLNRGVIAIIVLSASGAVILCCAVAWVLLFKHRDRVCQPDQPPPATVPSFAKSSGAAASMIGSGPSSVSLSFGSSIAPYAGSAKTYSSNDIERATDNFNESRILGEGGFGRVYSGVLDDGTKVAVKVLKRDDQQGGREFLAEVEMLSRLHHRNLVKLIGICTEERSRCLVYELIPNGSVESHLHGVDRDIAPFDWVDRMKIALGAARGLAYLHEDSSPRVIHRDFKSSNILLEHDFTPKVSDFGLARTALDEENKHISTRVMGTFGYVAPEYAMTGHLLVKSDVYSYGVVLLELLTGRKPVDMSQPPGQENLVSWARPRLTTKESLESIVDPSLGPNFPIDSIAKVAAIASMCVQPEVSHRPFMGEVVQALKLVCNECDEAKDLGSRTCSPENTSVDFDQQVGSNSGPLQDPAHTHSPMSNYGSPLDVERGLSGSDLFSGLSRHGRYEPGSLRRHSSSGPLISTQSSLPLWQRMRRLSSGSVSEHGVWHRLWPGYP